MSNILFRDVAARVFRQRYIELATSGGNPDAAKAVADLAESLGLACTCCGVFLVSTGAECLGECSERECRAHKAAARAHAAAARAQGAA